MMQKKQTILSKVLCVTLIWCCLLNILAFDSIAATPRWVSINSIDLNIAFDGSESCASGAASKQSTATSIEGTLTLYKLVDDEWVFMDEWYNIKTRGTLVVSGDFIGESGVTYKAVFVVTVYTGTTAETETVEYIDECP